MKKTAILIGALMFLGAAPILLFLFAPEERVLWAKSEWNRFKKDPAQTCFDLWADDLKDKKSAIIEKSGLIDGKLNVFYKAKNSFGAYQNGFFECHMKNGVIDKHKTLIEKLDNTLRVLNKTQTNSR